MVARAEALRAREPRRYPPLRRIAESGGYIDEAGANANRGSLVQADAHRANVALARPVRVPDVWAAASGVLGRTRTGFASRCGITVPADAQSALGDTW